MQFIYDHANRGEGLTIISPQQDAYFSAEIGGAANPGGSWVTVRGKEGFRVTMGNAMLDVPATGVTGRTSAASLVMTDKDGKIIWRAP